MCAHISGTAGCGRDLTPAKTRSEFAKLWHRLRHRFDNPLCQWAGLNRRGSQWDYASGCMHVRVSACEWYEWLISKGYTSENICIYTYMYTHVCTCVCVCICVFVFVCMHIQYIPQMFFIYRKPAMYELFIVCACVCMYVFQMVLNIKAMLY